jgi:hypothetical protein
MEWLRYPSWFEVEEKGRTEMGQPLTLVFNHVNLFVPDD